MGHEINIKESIEDDKSWFNIKRFTIGNTHFERPEKTLDIKSVNKEVYYSVIKEQFKFCEATKVIRDYKSIEDLYKEDEDSKINIFFYNKKWLMMHTPNILNFTFEFNPFKFVRRIEDMSGFLDQYYGFSKLFVSVPNIRTVVISSNPYKKENIIDVSNYIKFVDSAYSILRMKNNKPIFVPISLRMSLHDLDLLVEHYLKKEYYYHWFDFEGKPINENSLSRLRHVFRKITEAGYYDKTLSYFTNVKREIISNPKSNESPASDILCSIAGANLIGVNREPRRIIGRAENLSGIQEHKARLFNEKTYFYVKTKRADMLSSKYRNISYNAIMLAKELQNQNDFFLTHSSLTKLMQQKEMLKTYKNGSILRQLNSKSFDEVSITDWF